MANMRSFSSDEQVKNELYCHMNYFCTCSDEIILVKSDSVSLPELVSVKWLRSINSLEQVIWEMYRSIHIASHNSQVGSSYLRDKYAEAFTMPVKNKLFCTRFWSTFKLWVCTLWQATTSPKNKYWYTILLLYTRRWRRWDLPKTRASVLWFLCISKFSLYVRT
jgi:hypothetical protein